MLGIFLLGSALAAGLVVLLGSKSEISASTSTTMTTTTADGDNNRAVRYYTNDTIGTVVAGNSTPGDSPSELNAPKGIAVDQYGAIIVADSSNYRIQRFPLGSTVGTTLAINSTTNILGQVRDLHINVNNEIFVTDSDYSHVIKYYPNNGVGVTFSRQLWIRLSSKSVVRPIWKFRRWK
ncbi:unnamed protein product [Rotaria magnacalcarata]|uniref:NHL repeat containing protein n=1 Tax=Rotaria magnacalcarata TaxID=392030 RepID=A0A8S2W0U0_9BILA|nr:unnamed protein product [Rotaria magnacalcarata]